MMLVDTTVWIDFFLGKESSQVIHLSTCIEQKNDLYLCGIILTEILQGIKDNKEYMRVDNLLSSLIFIDMSKITFREAANIYRKLRMRGITIRKTLDCMIAAIAIENKIPLLHNDRDFDPIEKHCGLRILRT